MLEDSKIEEYLNKNKLYSDSKLHYFFFKMMAEVKEKLKGEPLNLEELEKLNQKVQSIIDNKKMTINEEFNMIYVYRLSLWERENKKKINRRERLDIGNMLAYELGVEELFANKVPTYLLYQIGVMPKDKICPVDMRKEKVFFSPLKKKYNKIFQDLNDRSKRTIKGFKREIYHVLPLTAKKITAKVAVALLETVIGLEAIYTGTFELGIKSCEAQKYETILADYENRMDTYVNDLRAMNLTDIQAIMKIIDDVHKNTQGMAFFDGMDTDPKIDLINYWRLAVGDSEGYGVCRNFADHFTYVLNQYNPEFNAHNMSCDMDVKALEMANVKRHEREYTVEEEKMYSQRFEEQKQATVNAEEQDSDKHSANHMVTVIDVPGEDYRLVIDTLNPAIYLMNDNELVPLNNSDGTIYYTPGPEFLLGLDYQMNAIKNIFTIRNTHKTKEEISEIKQIWGINAQNEALYEVQNMPGSKEIGQKAFNATDEKTRKDIIIEDEIRE